MMPGYEKPFKWWFDFHLFSEMDSAKATKEKKVSVTLQPTEYKWLLSYLALENCVSHVLQRRSDLLRAAEGSCPQRGVAYYLFFSAALSLCPGMDKM